MSTKHTPGNWVKGTNTSKLDWMQIFCNGKMIAEVKELSKKGERKAIDFEQEGANAKLIAAAPDLLEALAEAIQHVDSKFSPVLKEKCFNAINKATL